MKKNNKNNRLFPRNKTVYCPLCDSSFPCSDYLESVIKNEKTLWFANMITHYRHNHITSWNKCWGYRGNAYRSKWFQDYDTEKMLVNERAKRQIIRKAKNFLIDNKFNSFDFELLQGNSRATIDLVNKTFIQ